MNKLLQTRLSFMMFLEFFIWGGWFVTLGTFLANNLDATDSQIGLAFASQSWGAIIAPFIIGLIADRFFNAERILGLIHLIGAVLMYLMASAPDFSTFYPYVMGYMVLYMPTLALVNSISFRQMSDPSQDFAKVRVLGTIGWIVAGLVISYVFSWDSQAAIREGYLENTFLMCAVASALLGVYSFTLPSTPPKVDKDEEISIREILGLDALAMLKDRNFLIFFVSSVLISIPLAFYYQNANPFLAEIGVENPTGLMTIGQASEVLFMLLIPFFLTRFGIKWTLLFGMLAWAVRYVLFAYGDPGSLMFMLIIGIALHGICYDFFFVAGQIYTDSKAGEKFKSSAQGLITLATYGVGMLIGFWAAGQISEAYTTPDGAHEWLYIWLIPAIFAAFVFVVYMVTFKPEDIEYDVSEYEI
ncbi:MAG: nucleoside permease [Balneolaceae bacterium]|nr:nucleoside permease [Balneolaceae bacterium]